MMQNLKSILVDDEPRGISAMQKLLEINCPDVEIVSTATNVDDAIEKIRSLKPQLVFLDISMPVKNGFDLLKETKDLRFEVIFVTAHNEFMIEAFHFSAIDYLLKPVDDDLLKEAVKRAAKRIEEKNGNSQIETLLHNVQNKQGLQKVKLCIPSLKGFQVVEVQNIIYCEAGGNYTNIHFSERPIICASKPIHEYESLLSDCGFIRIHKSFLVNLEHIREYIRGEGGSVILSNNHEVEVSRRKKDLLMSGMKAFYKF